ncbi:hypothetical protein [uncultured Adlercreutzia sp.]|uniref:hypothetical protein n=1 Tax=uncultured Adlercreutzia sp. TaxID=875803 RepID=UPI0026F3945D|nr:hypothetical protein [uncultured Adlercreutzia sp.]
MFDAIIVHPRVNQRHPEVSDEDAIAAWRHPLAITRRAFEPPDIYTAAGVDGKGRLLELIGVELEDGSLMIYHAMKPTRKMSQELGLL